MMMQPLPTEDRSAPVIPTERVGVVVERLILGHRYSTQQVADIAGVSPEGARLMLIKLSRLLPIRYENQMWIYERRS
jgi:hypothetical protein